MDTKLIITRLGGSLKLSRQLNLTQPAVSQWVKNGIPAGWLAYLQLAHPDAFQEPEPAQAEQEQQP